jgi:hypothetical protein
MDPIIDEALVPGDDRSTPSSAAGAPLATGRRAASLGLHPRVPPGRWHTQSRILAPLPAASPPVTAPIMGFRCLVGACPVSARALQGRLPRKPLLPPRQQVLIEPSSHQRLRVSEARRAPLPGV